MSVFDAPGFDARDPAADLQPLIAAVLGAPATDERYTLFCEVRDRLVDHFEAMEPTLYAALRRFPHLSLRLMEAAEARDEIRRAFTTLSLLPADSSAWIGLFATAGDAACRYLSETEARLVRIAGGMLGQGELRRLGVEANRIRGVYAADHHVTGE
jgi:hypothetical protein